MNGLEFTAREPIQTKFKGNNMILLYTDNPNRTTYKKVSVDIMKLKHGTEAVYLPSKRGGIKLYEHLSDARIAHQCQSEAYRLGIAPEVLSGNNEFRLPKEYENGILQQFFRTGIAFGYFTQIVDVNMARVSEQELDDIKERAISLSFNAGDIHEGNVGYIGDKMVMIDFGSATCICKGNTYIRLPRVNTDILHPKRKHRTPQMEKDISSIFRMKGM